MCMIVTASIFNWLKHLRSTERAYKHENKNKSKSRVNVSVCIWGVGVEEIAREEELR